ncbi:hypothetical protein KBZ17_03345 [Cyanobium sp. A2C-AMD]|nr:hypothetical protein [Cyanobium sp. A2C-AMD]
MLVQVVGCSQLHAVVAAQRLRLAQALAVVDVQLFPRGTYLPHPQPGAA